MIFGHPGVGKSHIVRACQQQFEKSITYVNSPDLISRHSFSQDISNIFSKSKQKDNHILIIDSLQSIANIQSVGWRVQEFFLEQLTKELLDQKSSLRIILVTQTISKLDPCLKKIVDTEQIVTIGFPTDIQRLQIMKQSVHQSQAQIDFFIEDLVTIAQKTEGFTCCDILILIKDAFYAPVRRLMTAKKFKRLENGKFAIASAQEEGQMLSIQQISSKIDLITTKEDLIKAFQMSSPSVPMKQLLNEQAFLTKWAQNEKGEE